MCSLAELLICECGVRERLVAGAADCDRLSSADSSVRTGLCSLSNSCGQYPWPPRVRPAVYAQTSCQLLSLAGPVVLRHVSPDLAAYRASYRGSNEAQVYTTHTFCTHAYTSNPVAPGLQGAGPSPAGL